MIADVVEGYILRVVVAVGYPLAAFLKKANSRVRRLGVVALLAATGFPAYAAKRTTVAQLEQALDAASSAHKADAEIARQIAGLELTERLTDPTLSRLAAHLISNSQTARALELLADRSAFLEPPANEVPSAPVPDPAAQTRMLQAARNYVSQTMPRLPNFLANRVIDLYDDRPQPLKKGDWPTRSGLHLIGTSTGEISVRNERENQPATQGSSVWQAKMGLISGGEFGNTLGMILTDADKGSIAWSHWENSVAGQVAVFQYAVPAAASHYEVLSTMKREEIIAGVDTPAGGARGVRGIGTRPNVSAANATVVHTRPGYHGSIWVNPADGAILRITMDADLNRGAPFRRAAILVEYGPVEIGGSRFICPVRSIALSVALADSETITGDAPSEWLNETHFTNYHRFGSTTRILADGTTPPAAEAQPEKAQAGVESAHPAATPASPGEPSHAETQSAPAPVAMATPEPATPKTTSEAAPGPTSPESPSPALQPVAGADVPDLPRIPVIAQQAPIPDSGLTLHVEVPELVVPVVVRDKHGHAVGNLAKEDFAVFDQGKLRTITGFTAITSAPAGGGPPSVRSVSSATPANSAAREAPPPTQNRFLLFLFDDRHLTSSDLAITQKAAIKMLDQPLGPAEYANVLSFMGVNSGFTRDRAALQAAIGKLSVHQANQHSKNDCPDIDYYAADKILNQHDAQEFSVAVAKAKACTAAQVFLPSASDLNNPTTVFERLALSTAAHALAAGEEDARQSLVSLETVVRAMTKLPGQRTLILVSPGFLSLSPDLMTFKSRVLDEAAGANVVINALDARGLYVGNADASQGPQESVSQMLGSTSSDHFSSVQESDNAMAELAYGTGGTFFHNSNDLEGGLRSLAAAPEYLYLLQVSLKDVKPNGTFHQLRVNVDRHDLNVQSRRGYFAPKAKSKNK